MQKIIILLLCVFGGISASAQILTAQERKELEAELKELKEQLKNADADERKELEAIGLPKMIQFMEKQLAGPLSDNKGVKKESSISDAAKSKIQSKAG